MFLKDAKLKKIVKEAYKYGILRLGDIGDKLYISGSYWIITIKKAMIPKTVIAMLYETAGELPAEGMTFLATPSGNQVEMEWTAKEIMTEGMEKAVLTDVILEGYTGVMQRIIQTSNTGSIILINEAMIEMLDAKGIDRDNGESELVGPMCNQRGVCWTNNVMTILVAPREDNKHEKMLKSLETIWLE